MKATRVQYCQMSVICPSNFWCVWQCDMMSDKNTCSPALKKPSNKPMENPIIFYGFHSTNWRRYAVFCRSSLWKQSSLGNKVLQVLKFFFQESIWGRIAEFLCFVSHSPDPTTNSEIKKSMNEFKDFTHCAKRSNQPRRLWIRPAKQADKQTCMILSAFLRDVTP